MIPLRIMVLGLGGNVSQGILKALHLSNLPYRVFGACVSPSVGHFAVEKSYISPYAADHDFLSWLKYYCWHDKVDVVMSGVEEVLLSLAKFRSELPICIVSDQESLQITQDKFATCLWLEEHGLDHPEFTTDPAVARDIFRRNHVLLAKKRHGKGSQGLIFISDHTQLDYALTLTDYVYQEWLSGLEYTVGCWSDQDGQVRGCIIMQRELVNGTTSYATVVNDPVIRDYAIQIATQLKPMGPCNIQLKLTSRGPVCFEINNRFSGTTPARARLGFNDVEATLRHYVMGESAWDLPVITTGMMRRYWNEIYVTGKRLDQIEDWM